MLAVVFAVLLQQAAPAAAGQAVWATPSSPVEAAPAVEVPPIPDYARADPYAYERAECSPLIRKAAESLEACQQRVRVALAANLGAAMPPAMAPAGSMDDCRQEAAGDRYALQCGTPQRAERPTARLQEQTCETRPQAQANGGVVWVEDCRPESGRGADGLAIRLGRRD